MHFATFLEWLSNTQFSIVMRDSVWGEPIVETVHVLTLTIFFGFAVLLDLRLLGVVLKTRPISEVLKQLNFWLYVGYVIMIVSGLLLFISDPVSFYSTLAFKLKMILLVFVGINALVFNMTIGRRTGEWDLTPHTPWQAKMAGCISLVLWVSIIALGRIIAYTIPLPM